MAHTDNGKEFALGKLAERKGNRPKQIDNSSLYAGSPMYFYCQACGHLSDTKPEDYNTAVRLLCEECQALKDLDWLG
jgi:hypothetical protein